MPRRAARPFLNNLAVAAVAVLAAAGVYVAPGRARPELVARAADPVTRSVTRRVVRGAPTAVFVTAAARHTRLGAALSTRDVETRTALAALAARVRPLSHPRALEDAFRSYFAYRAAHPGANPHLYFVDYGLPSTEPRGYLFDMAALRVVEGPFPVAHGRGSPARRGVPTRFSNAFGSASTSLGLYVAQELYAFRGTASGRAYRSVGLRLAGVSGAFNDRARARGVVAHGAPYVTARGAGRSEGCPAVEPARARRLLPKLAHGGLVFLFAPDARWMAADPWLAAAGVPTSSAEGAA